MYLIFSLVFISVGGFICFNAFRRACRSRRAPPVISNVLPETKENEQNKRQGTSVNQNEKRPKDQEDGIEIEKKGS